MKRSTFLQMPQGPFRADQLHSGDAYELSHGHAILCLPTGGRGARAVSAGAKALASDPAVQDVGFDTGFSPAPDMLRAPDLAVGVIPDEPGWVAGAPPLAVEYADTGQDETKLALKIQDLLDAGTRFVWVVRLIGPRRVEVHQTGKPVRIALPGDQLEAPGILANPLPVEALYDREVSDEVSFRNLLQRHGYESLDAVRAEGEATGEAKGEARGEAAALRAAILEVFAARDLAVGPGIQAMIADCHDLALLRRWHRQAITAASTAELAPR
jgi:Uma2 family endonuclease